MDNAAYVTGKRIVKQSWDQIWLRYIRRVLAFT